MIAPERQERAPAPRRRAARPMADFTRLDDEDEVLEDAYADVAASIDSLRMSLRPLEGTLPTATVDQTLTLCWERFGAAQRELREFEVDFADTSATQQLIADQQVLAIQPSLDVVETVLDREGPQIRKTFPSGAD